MNDTYITGNVAKFVHDLDLTTIPQEILSQAKHCITDNIGAILAGLSTKTSQIVRQIDSDKGASGKSSLFGTNKKVSIGQAVFANCISASSLDIDDGHFSGGHPGSIIIPSTLAIGENYSISGKSFIEAIIVGYEVAIRAINTVSGPSSGTGLGGTYGVAAAASKVMDFTVPQISQTIGLSSIHAPITETVTIWENGYMAKESIGWGAVSGMESAILVNKGFTGPDKVLDKYYATSWATIGSIFEILNVYFKRYPSCRWTHTALDLTVEIMKQNLLCGKDIKNVTVATKHPHTELNSKKCISIEQAQYSFPYVIGCVLAFGNFDWKSMNQKNLTNPKIITESEKVSIVHESKFQSERWPAKVTIQTTDGREFISTKIIPKGDPSDPISEKELNNKYFDLTIPVLGQSKSEEVFECIQRIESIDDINELTSLIQPSS